MFLVHIFWKVAYSVEKWKTESIKNNLTLYKIRVLWWLECFSWIQLFWVQITKKLKKRPEHRRLSRFHSRRKLIWNVLHVPSVRQGSYLRTTNCWTNLIQVRLRSVTVELHRSSTCFQPSSRSPRMRGLTDATIPPVTLHNSFANVNQSFEAHRFRRF